MIINKSQEVMKVMKVVRDVKDIGIVNNIFTNTSVCIVYLLILATV